MGAPEHCGWAAGNFARLRLRVPYDESAADGAAEQLSGPASGRLHSRFVLMFLMRCVSRTDSSCILEDSWSASTATAVASGTWCTWRCTRSNTRSLRRVQFLRRWDACSAVCVEP